MSFTTKVKNEISNNYGNISENIAELAAIFRNSYQKADNILEIVTENSTVCKHIYRLIKEIYHVNTKTEYKNTENFIDAVKEARRFEKSHEKLMRLREDKSLVTLDKVLGFY